LPEAVAYILYTSGSTGRPKGVMQSHRNVLHHMRNYTNNLYINPSDKLTLLASYSFDAAVMDIFGALLNGATLYPINIKEEGLGSITQCLLEQGVTIYHSTPTVYRYFLNTLTGKEVFSKLRLIVLGGEEVHKQDVDRYKIHFPPECIFVNGLGPTESTVSIQYFINHETRIPRSAVPVGYPVEDTEIILLDEAGEAETVYGEIAIRSPYIALGYWQRPELNQASFLPDPEGGYRRIYRTGDMGRLRPDNGFEFVGRKDSQLKIRGFRIEPGEVEAVLSQHTAVREVAVVAREDIPGDKRLVAYVVPNQGQTPTTADLRSFLNQSLPDYMVPAAFVILDALPLTPNGKINHLDLPAPQPSGQDEDSQDQAPKGGIEQRLARIWASLLNIEQVGRRDNFFELGGHSLLAIQLFIEIEKGFGRKLPLTTLFQAPTIEQLAQLISEDGAMTSIGSLVAIQPKGSRPPFFCIHGIGGHVLRYYDLSFHLGEDQPFYGLQSKGLDGGQALFLTVEDMAAHYIEEIQTVQPKGPYHLGGLSFGGLVAFDVARQLQREGQQVGLVALLDTYIAQAPRYVEAIPKAEFVRYKLSGLTGKIQYKVQGRAENIGNLLANVSTLSLQEGLTYLRQKVGKRPNHQAKARDDTSSGQLRAGFLPPRLFQDVWQANALASREYVPKPYSGEVTLFRSSALKGTYGWDEFLDDYGWGQVARGGVRIFETPGNHLTIIEEPNVKILAEQLKAGMAWTFDQDSEKQI
jgi:amino acid adenylation domain-containing protein